VANQNPQRIGPPIPFLTAVWAGMSRDDLLAGLRNGDIERPARLPDWARGLDGAAPPTAAASGARAADREHVRSWFQALDPALQASSFDAIWAKAGATDEARAAKLTSCLSQLLSRPGDTGRDAGADPVAQLDALLATGDRHATVVELGGKTGEELAMLAETDAGYRHALARLDSFALTNSEGLFPASDPADGGAGHDAESGAWLSDRGKFLAWKLSQDAGEPVAVAGRDDWTFVDQGSQGADGTPFTVDVRTGRRDASRNQVVFGTAGDEVFKGVDGSDRVYAGGGDDVLRGGRGADRLEGGDGDDLAMGGAGNDEVIGGRGDDELDGGRGDDRLEGGSGHDTYLIDSGDGADTILDVDGAGNIELDGDALRGALEAVDGKWLSADGKVQFALDGDLTAGGTLTISTFAGSASDGEPPQNTITVNNWKNGDLGITLGADSGDGEPAPLDSLPVTSSADLASRTWKGQGATSLDGSGILTGAASSEAMQAAADNGGAHVAPYAGAEGAVESQSDYDAALASLLGNRDPTFNTVDPTSYRDAIDAFSGVLEPPDVSGIGNAGDSFGVSAVTEAAMMDAIAGDYAGNTFDNFEPTPASAIPPVDVASLMELKQAGVGTRSNASL
jgi:hypothetical protein